MSGAGQPQPGVAGERLLFAGVLRPQVAATAQHEVRGVVFALRSPGAKPLSAHQLRDGARVVTPERKMLCSARATGLGIVAAAAAAPVDAAVIPFLRTA